MVSLFSKDAVMIWIPILLLILFRVAIKHHMRKSRDAQMIIWNDHVTPTTGPTELPRISGIWEVVGPVSNHNKMPRRMTIYRLPGTETPELLIHSCIACNEETMAKIQALGKPKILVIPNRFHTLDAGVWIQRFPDMAIVCPESAKLKLARKNIEPTHPMEEHLASYGISCLTVGVTNDRPMEYILSLPVFGTDDNVLVCSDTWFNIVEPFPGFGYKVMSFLGSIGPFKITKMGTLFIKDWERYADDLESIKTTENVVGILVGHGAAIAGYADSNKALLSVLSFARSKAEKKKDE
ncbi:hypothetical protein J8273_7154 [Carpediemonas membranifera]|uniref:Uncharacterized protein n=1 Tax=Carpediemonas membranifera TaxID=201153 RepID=A0A8J6AZ97_9EUKA|nr:hypothetical protein J8273_7154 [Carpediemonas membranifera]|eukprot:KAG9390889.1 hypothetical protein J8273_7154 [Carpediemonas membranifera]